MALRYKQAGTEELLMAEGEVTHSRGWVIDTFVLETLYRELTNDANVISPEAVQHLLDHPPEYAELFRLQAETRSLVTIREVLVSPLLEHGVIWGLG